MAAYRRSFLLLMALLSLLLAVPVAGNSTRTEEGPFPTQSTMFGATWYPRLEVNLFGFSGFGDLYRPRFYYPANGSSEILNTNTGAYIHSLPGSIVAFRVTKDYLYGYTQTHSPEPSFTIYIMDADDWTQLQTIQYICPSDWDECLPKHIVEGPEGRLYVAHHNQPIIDIYNRNSGEHLGSATVGLPQRSISCMAINGEQLFIGPTTLTSGEKGLGVFDISSLEPQLVNGYAFSAGPYCEMAPDGSFLVAYPRDRTLSQFQTEPFELIRTYEFGREIDPIGINLEGGIVLAKQDKEDRPGVIEINSTTGAISHAITPTSLLKDEYSPSGLFLLHRGELATSYSALFKFVVWRRFNFGSAVPLTFHTACPGGKVKDDFTDPNSGWPTGTRNGITYEYLNGEYRIAIREAGSWTAVTRGDVWAGGKSVEVFSKSSSSLAVSGLIYGLNNDWSDFYTIELVPYNSRWYNFHYHDGRWETVISDELPQGFHEPLRWEIVRPPFANEIQIKLANEVIMTIPEFTGRVGLTAAALMPNVNVRYQDYTFIGANCDLEDSLPLAKFEVAPEYVRAARLNDPDLWHLPED